MKVMVFDVGGTGIKYSVMDEQLNRTDTGSTPTPADSQEHFLNTLREIYLPHKGEVDGIALSLPGFIDAEQGVVDKMSYISDSVIEIDVEAELPDSYVQQPAAAGSGSRMTAKRPPLQSWSGVC